MPYMECLGHAVSDVVAAELGHMARAKQLQSVPYEFPAWKPNPNQRQMIVPILQAFHI